MADLENKKEDLEKNESIVSSEVKGEEKKEETADPKAAEPSEETPAGDFSDSDDESDDSEDDSGGRKRRGPRSQRTRENKKKEEDSGFVEKVISINRVTKVTKGGKKLSFSALVVVGDAQGKVGYSLEKAAEVSIAIRKAMTVAKKNMIAVPMKGATITHEIIGQCAGSRVLLKPASEGTGVIASGPVRAVCDGAGIHDILTKVHRSNNPINVVKATIDGLSRLKRVQSNANA